MDPFLANLYKTAEIIGASPATADVEKLAQAKFIDGMICQDTGLNYDQVDPNIIIKVATGLFGAGNLLKTAEDVAEAKPEEKAEEKAEEKKETPAEEKKEHELPPFIAEKKEEGEKKEAAAVTEAREKLAEADFLGRLMAHAYVNELANIEKQASTPEQPAPAEKVAEQSPVLAEMAKARALEMLKEAGYAEQPTPEQTKQAQLQQTVDQMALQMLKDAGYPVE